jgi:HEAT repeat protein
MKYGLLILTTLAIVYAAGCSSPDGSPVLGMGRPTSELIQMALDPADADRRREGIAGLSQRPADANVLKVYAVVAGNAKEEPTVRGVAMVALGKSGNAEYLPTVVQSLDDPSPQVRWDAAIALDNLIGQAAVEPLRRHVAGDVSMDVRSCCARALRHYPRKDVVGTLASALGDREYSVRREAHASLVQIAGRDEGGRDMQAWLLSAQRYPAAPPASSAARADATPSTAAARVK